MSGGISDEDARHGPLRRKRLGRKEWRLILLTIAAVAVTLPIVFAPLFAPRDPLVQSLEDRIRPPGSRLSDGSIALLGTDQTGRDILSRILYGGRVSLVVAFGAVLLSASLGTVLGLTAGYFGGRIGNVIMRIADIQLAFPGILLALVITATLGSSVPQLILALGISSWVLYARLVRGDVLRVRQEEYVVSAVAVGATNRRIMFRHVLPNVMNPVVILGALQMGQMIITESTLSFVGLGIHPPTPSWGGMVEEGRNYLHVLWWLSTLPGLAIATTVLTMGRLGDAVRDVLDPRFQDH